MNLCFKVNFALGKLVTLFFKSVSVYVNLISQRKGTAYIKTMHFVAGYKYMHEKWNYIKSDITKP